MEGLSEHLKQQAEMQGAQFGAGGQQGENPRNIPVTGDIVGFGGIKLDEE